MHNNKICIKKYTQNASLSSRALHHQCNLKGNKANIEPQWAALAGTECVCVPQVRPEQTCYIWSDSSLLICTWIFLYLWISLDSCFGPSFCSFPSHKDLSGTWVCGCCYSDHPFLEIGYDCGSDVGLSFHSSVSPNSFLLHNGQNPFPCRYPVKET